MITISKTEEWIQVIYDQLLSDSVQFQPGSSDFLDRLDAMTQLVDLSESEPSLTQEAYGLMVCGFEKMKELSGVLKDFIFSTPETKSNQHELGLLKKLLLQEIDSPILKEYEYVVAYEWWAEHYNSMSGLTEAHQGDIVLMNDRYTFLVVELKYIHKANNFWRSIARQQRTGKVCRQARKFGRFFSARFPWADVEYVALTNVAIYHGRKDRIRIAV